MEKNALCLSGGGIKAFAHIGAIKALEESKKYPNTKFIYIFFSFVHIITLFCLKLYHK